MSYPSHFLARTSMIQVFLYLTGELHFPSELRLVLMGAKNAGKSSAGNTILGREQFDVGLQTTGCAEGHRRIRGQSVTVLDTPGCLSARPDFLLSSPAYGVTVVLVVVNMSSSFTLSHWKTTEKHLEQFGERVRSQAIVVFTFGTGWGTRSLSSVSRVRGKVFRGLWTCAGTDTMCWTIRTGEPVTKSEIF